MATIQQDLYDRAAAIARKHLRNELEPLGAYWEELSVVLSGSAASPFADPHSTIDILFVGPQAVYESVRQGLADAGFRLEHDHFQKKTVDGQKVKYNVYSLEYCRQLLEDYDDRGMTTLPRASIIQDPGDQFAQLIAGYDEYPADVLASKIEQTWQELRDRQASLAWSLRRGQPFVFLDNLTSLSRCLLTVCFYLEGEPPVGKKWLFSAGLRTRCGQELRPLFLRLFKDLDQVMVLGGSYDPHQNPLYQLVSDLTAAAREAAGQQGIELP